MTLDFNVNPYYDDFNEVKQYARILFRPGYAVQARELTQLQTMFQKQLERLGKFSVSDGSPVVGGLVTSDFNAYALKVRSYTGSSDSSDISELVGKMLTGRNSKYKVVDSILTTDKKFVSVTTNTIIVKEITGYNVDSSTEYTPYQDIKVPVATAVAVADSVVQGDFSATVHSIVTSGSFKYVRISGATGNFTTGAISIDSVSVTASAVYKVLTTEEGYFVSLVNNSRLPASVAHIDSGVYFARGLFNYVEEQTVTLSVTSSSPTVRVGLAINETLVDDFDDETLVDIAQGSPNYTAPGAHRYKLELELTGKEFDSSFDSSTDSRTSVEIISNVADSDFIELMRVDSGTILKWVRYPILGEIEKTLARRTYDESGNYTVRSFPIRIDEIEDDDENFTVSLEPGKAYVKGFEFETISTTELTVPKSRETDAENNDNVVCAYGGYVLCDTITLDGIDTTALSSVILCNSSNVKMGTARVYQILKDGSNYRVYLMNVLFGSQAEDIISAVDNSAYIIDNVSYLTNEDDDTVAEIDTTSGQANGKTIFFNTSKSELIFPLSKKAIKTLKPSGVVDTDVIVTQRTGQTGLIASSSNTITINSSGQFTSGDVSDYIIVEQTTGAIVSTFTVDSVSGNDATITLTPATTAVYIFAPISFNTKSEKKKSLQTGSVTYTSSTPTDWLTDHDWVNLGRSDIFELTSVTVDGVDNTDKFELDNGQRDLFYDWGKVRVKTDETVTGTTIVINFSYFTHVGDSYCSVDSYSSAGINYEDIPQYVSPTTGKTFELRDVLDFRPRREDSASTTGSSITGEANTYSFESAEETIPTVNSVSNVDFEYYLSRIDKIAISADKEFVRIEGSSSLNPIVPNDLDNTMTLCVLSIPAYTFNVTDVSVQFIDNRRYTMRDIGSLEKRISNLEYYTSLSLLEKDAQGLNILNDVGESRLKNGFLVDSFTGHSIGDVQNSDYNCSINFQTRELNPPFESNLVKLEYDAEHDDVSESQKTGDLVTLSYTKTTFLDQPLASKSVSVNPFNVTAFVGQVVLTPAVDTWIDTDQRPDVLLNLTGDQDANLFGDKFKFTEWNDWNTRILGEKVLSQTLLKTEQVNKRFVRDFTNQIVAQTSESSRTGVEIEGDILRQNAGSRITDLSIRPYIRSLSIAFSATGLRPFATVYPFFDNENVSEFATPIDGVVGGTLTTDETGSVSGTFAVPAGTFRTGHKIFKLTDVSTSSSFESASTTAEEIFSAQGLLVQKEDVIVATRSSQFTKREVSESSITNQIISREVITGRKVDPLAQTFFVSESDFPSGIFLESLDLYFESIPTSGSLPVSVEIRPVVNGYPHSATYLPFSQVVKQLADVSTGLDTPTNFQFSSPVYLAPGEYCFVILSNDSDYRVYSAAMGEKQLNSQVTITEQPYIGSLFKSQNASTWTAEQNEDLKFRLNRCSFSTSEEVAVFVNEQISASDLETSSDTKALIDLYHIASNNLTFIGTELSFEYKAMNVSSTPTLDSSYTVFEINNDVFLKQRKEINVSDPSTAPSLVVKATMSTNDEAISPVIDTAFMNAVAIKVKINNNSTDEDGSSGGSASARYITRKVTLEEPSRDLKVFLDAYKPYGSDIKVYYKALASDSQNTFESQEYSLLTQETDSGVYSSETGDFKEFKYETDRTSSSSKFTIFAIKIVMLSSSTVKFPIIKNLRVIALDSTSDE